MIQQEWVQIDAAEYIYRAVHRIMEGDCQMEHGPFSVCIGPLMAQKYCVTNQMYYDFLQSSGYEPKDSANYLKHWENGKYRLAEEDFPVVNISQADAIAYAAFYGWRLPTEQEWQYLAAGPGHNRWPWGNEKQYSRCNVYGKTLEPVNSHPDGVSCFGLYNMCGNVWEYTNAHLGDGEGNHFFVVLRGGSYYTAPHYWHAEGGAVPNDFHLKMHLIGSAMDRCETVGFRCVKECE